MCGIAGIFTVDRSKDFDEVNLARALLLAIEQRGRHATGLAFVKDEITIVDKADMPARDFVQASAIFTDGFGEAQPRAVSLHARYATQGTPADNFTIIRSTARQPVSR
jgi:glutamine phosphoribosylpyrophosphate amidotransferase